MDSIKNMFKKRDYTEPSDIENMTAEDILKISPDNIKTSSITGDPAFHYLKPDQQAAIMVISQAKTQNSYPTIDELMKMFQDKKSHVTKDVRPYKGGKRRSRKQNTKKRQQRRRKSRRSQ